MTCIIGMVEKGIVYMGADSLGSNGWTKDVFSTPKLFTKEDMLIGYTTSYRFGQLLQYDWSVPERSSKIESDTEYLVKEIVKSIRNLLGSSGAKHVKDSIDEGGNCLIGYRGHIYELQPDFSILTAASDVMVVGSGEQIAMGAMHALDIMEPKKRIKKALDITSELVTSVGGPYLIESLK